MARRTELLGLRIPANLSRPRRSLCGEAEALTWQVARLHVHLKDLSVGGRQRWDTRMTALAAEGSLGCWERIVLASLRPEVVGTPDFERWQTATKLIRSPDLTPAQLLALAIELASQGRVVAAIYGLSRCLRESSPRRGQTVRALCLVITAINDARLHKRALLDEQACQIYVAFQQQCRSLLLGLLQSPKVDHHALANELERLETLLGQEGAHGHALALRWLEKLLPSLPAGGWLVEVGCSREIIEGQHSTAQLAGFARRHGLPFAGIDLDPENINALRRELGVQGRRWVCGKGEEVLASWKEPIAALYLDAYDFWHRSHSEIREEVYRTAYGSGINDEACQQMHLIAAQEGSKRMQAGGLLAIDDTWLEAGAWTGKGALAVPWLMEQSWTMLEATHRAVLFTKKASQQPDVLLYKPKKIANPA
jgi:hypothetical protein